MEPSNALVRFRSTSTMDGAHFIRGAGLRGRFTKMATRKTLAFVGLESCGVSQHVNSSLLHRVAGALTEVFHRSMTRTGAHLEVRKDARSDI